MSNNKSHSRKVNSRKIYENHFGPIPVDDSGRTYDVHHIDYNRNNNDPTNLIAVSIEEHYKIHADRGDWAACYLIGIRMKLSSEELGELSSKQQRKRIEEGTHPFTNPEYKRRNSLARVADGTHNFLGKRNPVHERVANGTHHLLGGDIQRKNNKERLENGTHNFLNSEFQRNVALARLEKGTHNFCGDDHPNKRQLTCPHCGKTGGQVNMKRWHFDNCKSKT